VVVLGTMPWRTSDALSILFSTFSPGLTSTISTNSSFRKGGKADHVCLQCSQLGKDLLHAFRMMERDLFQSHNSHGGYMQCLWSNLVKREMGRHDEKNALRLFNPAFLTQFQPSYLENCPSVPGTQFNELDKIVTAILADKGGLMVSLIICKDDSRATYFE